MPKLTIAGAEHDVPDALAPIIQGVIADNAKLLADSKAALETLSAAKTKAENDAKAQADAKTQAEIAAAAKAGDYTKATDLANARLRTLSEAFRDSELARAVEAHPNLRKTTDAKERETLVADVVAGLRATAAYDVDKRVLSMKAADGKELTLAAAIDGYLADRPHLRAANVPGGSGAGTQTGNTGNVGIKRSAMSIDDRADYVAKHGQAAYLALPY